MSRAPMLIIVFFLALMSGVLLAAQPAANAVLARGLGSPYLATLVSLGVSVLCVLPVFLVAPTTGAGAGLGAIPWWGWAGGVAGAVFVTAALMWAPVVGLPLFLSVVVLGQMVGALLLQHYGLLGLPRIPVEPRALLGTLLVVAGVVLIRMGRAA
ncbi:MAG: DMT family transporter [Shimia sp.]